MRKIKNLVRKHPLLSSKAIFDKAGLSHIKKDTCYRALRKLALIRKASKRPPLSQRNIIKRLAWARKYLKQDFSYVIFTDEWRATLDGPPTGGTNAGSRTIIKNSQQGGGGGVMF